MLYGSLNIGRTVPPSKIQNDNTATKTRASSCTALQDDLSNYNNIIHLVECIIIIIWKWLTSSLSKLSLMPGFTKSVREEMCKQTKIEMIENIKGKEMQYYDLFADWFQTHG